MAESWAWRIVSQIQECQRRVSSGQGMTDRPALFIAAGFSVLWLQTWKSSISIYWIQCCRDLWAVCFCCLFLSVISGSSLPPSDCHLCPLVWFTLSSMASNYQYLCWDPSESWFPVWVFVLVFASVFPTHTPSYPSAFIHAVAMHCHGK